MKAVQLLAHGTPGRLQLVDVPDPAPAPDEVVVEVRACGLNRLDLWLEEGALPLPLQLPRIPGGEVSGLVQQLGAEVDTRSWRVGDRVAVQSNLFCGHCEFCLAGDESLCLNGQLLGVQRDGGFAERVVVPARALVHLPDAASFEASAAVTLAGSTAMHMLTNRTTVQAGKWVLVIGGGEWGRVRRHSGCVPARRVRDRDRVDACQAGPGTFFGGQGYGRFHARGLAS